MGTALSPRLRAILDEWRVQPDEFFIGGGCWAYAFVLGRKLKGEAYHTTEIPFHAWIEKSLLCFDINCHGVLRKNLLRTFLTGPYDCEKAGQEAARLAKTAISISLSDLNGKHKPTQKRSAKEFEISWELAVEFAEAVIKKRNPELDRAANLIV